MDPTRHQQTDLRRRVDYDLGAAHQAASAPDARRRKPAFVRPPLGSTPAGLTSGRSHRRPLPYNFVKQASRRLEIIALLAAVLWIFATVVYHVIDLKNAG